MQILSAPGALVRDPVTKRVVSKDDPLTINPLDLHWVRLLADGDVIAAPDPLPTPDAPNSDAPTEENDQ